MAFKLAEAFVEFKQRGLSGVQRGITGIGASMRSVGNIARSFQGQLAALGVGLGVGGMLKLAADAETLQVQFEVLLGSADKARAKLKELRDFAASTPFEMPDLAQSVKTMLGFDIAADDVIGIIRKLADVAALSGKDIKELSALYSKASKNGRLFADDVTRIAETGIPIYQALTDKFGVSGAALRKLVESGAADFEILVAAIDKATGAGGKFENGSAKLALTTAGKFSTMVDNIKLGLAGVGELFLPMSNVILDSVTGWAQVFQREWVPVLRDIRDIFGAITKGVWDLTSAFFRLIGSVTGLDSFFAGFGSGLAEIISGLALFANNWKVVLGIALLDTQSWVDKVLLELGRLPAEMLGIRVEMVKAFDMREFGRGMLKSVLLKAMEENVAAARKTAEDAAAKLDGGEAGNASKAKGPDVLQFDELARKIQTAGDNPIVAAVNEGNAIQKEQNEQLKQMNGALQAGEPNKFEAPKGGNVGVQVDGQQKAAGGGTFGELKQILADADEKSVRTKRFGHAVMGQMSPDEQAAFNKRMNTRQNVGDDMRQKTPILGRIEIKEFFRDPADADKQRQQTRDLVASRIKEKGGGTMGPVEIEHILKQLKATHDLLAKKGIKTDTTAVLGK